MTKYLLEKLSAPAVAVLIFSQSNIVTRLESTYYTSIMREKNHENLSSLEPINDNEL